MNLISLATFPTKTAAECKDIQCNDASRCKVTITMQMYINDFETQRKGETSLKMTRMQKQ